MCDICEKEFEEEENTNVVDDKVVCDSCLSNLNTCHSCEEKTTHDFTLGGKNYCEGCENDLPFCDNCQETVEETNEHGICPSCEDEYDTCICGEYVRVDDCLTDIHDNIVCPSCQEDGTIPDDSDRWYSFDDIYYHENDDGWYTYPPSEIILPYHYGEKFKIKGSNSEKYVGFELEVVPKVDRDELAQSVLDLGNFCCEEDGSLYDDGFEIISNYGDLEVVLQLANDLADTLQGKAISHDTSCCGLHVHLTKKDSDYANSKMVVFWNDAENNDFIKEFSRRDSIYAVRQSHKNKYNLQNAACYSDFLEKNHYDIVSVTDHTMEVRAFKGTIHKPRLLACIELSYYTYEYCSQPNVYAYDLTWSKFLTWLGDRSTYILPYLQSRQFELQLTTS